MQFSNILIKFYLVIDFSTFLLMQFLQSFWHRPMILMTATAPKWVEEKLISIFFPTGAPVVIRASTNRPNLIYQVARMDSVEDVCSIISEEAKSFFTMKES